MYKILEFYPEDKNGVEIDLIHPGVLTKTAGMSSELQDFIKNIEIKNSKVYILVNALGAGEYYGCFFKGQKIITDSGYKNIEDIKEDDLVLTHKKRFRKVLKTFSKEYSGEKISIKLQNRPEPQESTNNHPYWVVKKETVSNIKKDSETRDVFINKLSEINPIFVEAENLTPGDYVLVPYEYDKKSDEFDNDLAYLYGYYLSGGCLDKRYDKNRNNADGYEKIIFVMNLDTDIPMIEKLENISKKYGHTLGLYKTNSSEKTCRLELYWKQGAVELDRLFGHHSQEKYIHPDIFNQSEEWKLKFIAAYLDGDGHITVNSNKERYENTIKFSTVSRTLALDLQRLLASIDIVSTVSLGYNKNKNGCFGNEDHKIYECSIGSSYTNNLLKGTLRLKPLKNIERVAKNGGFYILNNGYMLMKITGVSSEYTKQTKYNLEIEEDNTYVVDFIGHNSNFNGDFIGEPVLQKYHKYFEENGNVYKHHINKDPQKSLGKILFSHYNPEMHRVELVCELDENKDESFINKILEGGYPAVSMGMRTPYDVCLSGETKVFGEKANICIDKISKEDMVYTHTGSLKKVLNVFKRTVDKYIELKPFGDISSIKGSTDHPMRVVKKHNFLEGKIVRKLVGINKGFNFIWENLENCEKGDYLVFKKTKKGNNFLNINQTTILGYFLSEGSYIKEKKTDGTYSYLGVSFSFGLSELDTFVEELKGALEKEYPEASPKIYINKERNSATLTFRSKKLVNLLLEFCGEYSDKKFINNKLFTLNETLLLNLLGKLINGDGSQDHNTQKGTIRYTTTSENLAKGVRRLAMEVGIPATINKYVQISKFTPAGVTVYNVYIQKCFSGLLSKYSTKVKKYKGLNGSRGFVFDDFILIPIQEKIIHNEKLDVYNIQVEGDETYQANNYVTHNCSICGHKSTKLPEYCDHLKYEMNRVYPDGRKVYAINPAAKFFDISFVVIPADPTAGVMKKLANHIPRRVKLSAELGEEFLRQAALFKEVETPVEISVISKDPGGKIYASQPLIPKKDIKAMVKDASLTKICSTLMGMRIMPKPLDFQRMVLYSTGHEKYAEALEKENISLIDVNENTKPIIPEELSLFNFDDTFAKKYAYLIPERALTKPLVTTRILEKYAFMSETPMEEAGMIPPKGIPESDKEDLEVYLKKDPSKIKEIFLGTKEEPKILPYKNPALATTTLSGLFYGLQKANNFLWEKEALNNIGRLDNFLLNPKRRWLIPALIGAGALTSVEAQKELHKSSAFKIPNAVARTLVAVPATYLYAGAQESKVRKGEPIGKFQNIVRKHPFLSSLGVIFGSGKIQKALLTKTSSQHNNLLKVISNLSHEQLDKLYEDVINI